MAPLLQIQLQAVVDGLMLGATYSLLGLGFTLIFGVFRRLNLAFGPTILVGIYAGSLWSRARPGSLLLVVTITLLGTLLAGIYVERCSFRALARQAPVVSMISTFAVSMQLQELVTLLPAARTMPYPAPAWLPGVEVGGVMLRSDGLFMWAGATLLMAALFLLLYRTRLGTTLRAVADSPEAATLMGVDVARIGVIAFVLASLVGGAAGILIMSSQQQVTPYFGLWATVKGLTVMLLGGAGSLSGAVAGGIVLGVVESEALWSFGGQWRDLAAYALLFAAAAASRGRVTGEPE